MNELQELHIHKCKCGNLAHPCYGCRCEDCYAEGFCYSTGPPYRLVGEGIELGGTVRPKFAIDRHWYRPKTATYS